MAINNKDWTDDTRALAACLEALLQLVRGQAGPAAAAANDARGDGATEPCARTSRDVAEGSGGE